jgi:hypothetical protein
MKWGILRSRQRKAIKEENERVATGMKGHEVVGKGID